MKRILYVRSGPYQVDPSSYNLQELGLASALKDLGYECDVLYYHKKRSFDQEIIVNGNSIKVLWRKGIRLLRSGVYPQVLKKDILSQYDCVICSEYSQIMSVLLLRNHNNVYIYNGPYYSLFKIPVIEPIYDFLFCKYINRNAKKIFSKTDMASRFLIEKGITNVRTVGVGLDTSKFKMCTEPTENTKTILNQLSGCKTILYIGQIIKRKNVDLIIKAFIRTAEGDNRYSKLVVVGKGESSYIDYCKQLIPEQLIDRVIWVDRVPNSETQFLYKRADLFLLPSSQEIFGMVLLEAMYFGCSVIASHSAGAETLIKNGENGFILDSFDVQNWTEKIMVLLQSDSLREKVSINASKTIKEEFMWNKIAKKMIEDIESNE